MGTLAGYVGGRGEGKSGKGEGDDSGELHFGFSVVIAIK